MDVLDAHFIGFLRFAQFPQFPLPSSATVAPSHPADRSRTDRPGRRRTRWYQMNDA
jgi:hypothetical protein